MPESAAGAWGGKSLWGPASRLLLSPAALPEGAGCRWTRCPQGLGLGLGLALFLRGPSLGRTGSFSDPPERAGESRPSSLGSPRSSVEGRIGLEGNLGGSWPALPPRVAWSARLCGGSAPGRCRSGGGAARPQGPWFPRSKDSTPACDPSSPRVLPAPVRVRITLDRKDAAVFLLHCPCFGTFGKC